MITEDYVSFEVAKLLKEKGFNEPCIATYNLVTKNFEIEEVYRDWTKHWAAYVSASTLQMAMKWLREVHKIDIDIISRLSLNADDDHLYTYIIKQQYEKYNYKTYTDGEYLSFEEACEAAIKYCLENLI